MAHPGICVINANQIEVILRYRNGLRFNHSRILNVREKCQNTDMLRNVLFVKITALRARNANWPCH